MAARSNRSFHYQNHYQKTDIYYTRYGIANPILRHREHRV